MAERTWIGTPVPRSDAWDKVTGRALYTSDVVLPGMAHAALVRSFVSHGRIRGVGFSAALEVPGVICTVTAADLAAAGVADPYYGLAVRDQPILPAETVRFAGEPVAAVVAESPAAAERAAGLVLLDIEKLSPALSTDDAMAGAALVHPERASKDPGLPNIAARVEYAAGDIEEGFAAAAHIHEATYRFPMIAHQPMEPYCSIASWTDDSTLEVVSGTQAPFKVQADLARMFGLRLNAVRVRTAFVGGGFGGKLLCKYEPLAAMLARIAQRPVRVLASAEECFQTVVRHGATIRIRTGLDAAGRIVARDTEVVFDTGAYADKGPGVAKKGAYRAKGPYDIPNFRSVALAVYTNKVPARAFRGYSTPQVAWAGESAVNEICADLGLDPLEFRTRNLLPRGGAFMPGDTPLDADLAEGISLAAGLGWQAPLPPGHGRGIATGVKDGGGGPSRAEAEVRLYPDGCAEVLTGTSEIGQGSLTVFAQIAAEELRCDYSSVRTRLPDTLSSPFDHGTEASRSTVYVGNAVRGAARSVGTQLTDMLALDRRYRGAWSLDGGTVRRPGLPDVRLADLFARSRALPEPPATARAEGEPEREYELGPVVGRGYQHSLVDASAPLGTPSSFYEVGHGAAEVAVDRETGQLRLVSYISVADVGRAINPRTCRAQDDGSALMGIGHTMFEELLFEGGTLVNPNLAEYRMARTRDLPQRGLESILLENQDGPGPYGAKGAGEGGIIAVSPAIAAAVFQACGARLRTLPFTPERVWHALTAAQSDRLQVPS